MTEWVTYGSVGGAAGNSRSYPESDNLQAVRFAMSLRSILPRNGQLINCG